MKNVIKEVFIMLLLCVAIILILAIVFYDYNPTNKEIPKLVTYQMPSELSEIKEEIETPLSNGEEQIIRTYELTEDDLKGYEKTNYDAGKVNPFEAYSNNENTNTVNNTTTNTVNKNNTTNKNNTNSTVNNNTTNKEDANKTGTFFNQVGK